jgi:hypothetical protein
MVVTTPFVLSVIFFVVVSLRSVVSESEEQEVIPAISTAKSVVVFAIWEHADQIVCVFFIIFVWFLTIHTNIGLFF